MKEMAIRGKLMDMTTEAKFLVRWPRYTRLSCNNPSVLNCPTYKSNKICEYFLQLDHE